MLHRWTIESQQTRYAVFDEVPRAFSVRIEREVRWRIAERGYSVSKQGHNAPFDLMVEGCRVEVKAAMYTSQGYRANMRDNDADVLILCCQNSSMHFFVIPFEMVRGLCYIRIASHDPRQYMGKFTPYYEAWNVLDEAIKTAVNPWQLHLLD